MSMTEAEVIEKMKELETLKDSNRRYGFRNMILAFIQVSGILMNVFIFPGTIILPIFLLVVFAAILINGFFIIRCGWRLKQMIKDMEHEYQ